MTERWREVRACEGCGYSRKVLVRDWGGAMGETWAHRCNACELERSAKAHAAQARALMHKANMIRIKRLDAKRRIGNG